MKKVFVYHSTAYLLICYLYFVVRNLALHELVALTPSYLVLTSCLLFCCCRAVPIAASALCLFHAVSLFDLTCLTLSLGLYYVNSKVVPEQLICACNITINFDFTRRGTVVKRALVPLVTNLRRCGVHDSLAGIELIMLHSIFVRQRLCEGFSTLTAKYLCTR